MSFSLQEEEFNSMSSRKCEELDTCLGSSHVSTYLKNQWICFGDLWSNFGRSFYHHNSETNNKAERSATKIITSFPKITFKITWYPGHIFIKDILSFLTFVHRFFLTMKYQFLKGRINSRIDQLLRLLCGDVQKYYR